jgi:hypothetical protein
MPPRPVTFTSDRGHRCCCARAASGHAAAVPPSNMMNSRRPMRGPPLRAFTSGTTSREVIAARQALKVSDQRDCAENRRAARVGSSLAALPLPPGHPACEARGSRKPARSFCGDLRHRQAAHLQGATKRQADHGEGPDQHAHCDQPACTLTHRITQARRLLQRRAPTDRGEVVFYQIPRLGTSFAARVRRRREGDEVAALRHSITSSARASNGSGTVTPSALASPARTWWPAVHDSCDSICHSPGNCVTAPSSRRRLGSQCR